jgi:hypothetical protein
VITDVNLLKRNSDPHNTIKSSAHSTPLQVVHRYRGVSGAVRDLMYHPNADVPFLAACGFDRYLHLWNTRTHSHCEMYLKLRWNRLLIDSFSSSSLTTTTTTTPSHIEHNITVSPVQRLEKNDDDSESDSEEESLWRSMQTVSDSPSKQHKRKKRDSDIMTENKPKKQKQHNTTTSNNTNRTLPSQTNQNKPN